MSYQNLEFYFRTKKTYRVEMAVITGSTLELRCPGLLMNLNEGQRGKLILLNGDCDGKTFKLRTKLTWVTRKLDGSCVLKFDLYSVKESKQEALIKFLEEVE